MKDLWSYPFATTILQRLDVSDYLHCTNVCPSWNQTLQLPFYIDMVLERAQKDLKNMIFKSQEVKESWMTFFTNCEMNEVLKIYYYACLKAMSAPRKQDILKRTTSVDYAFEEMPKAETEEETIAFFQYVLEIQNSNGLCFGTKALLYSLHSSTMKTIEVIIPGQTWLHLLFLKQYMGKTPLHILIRKGEQKMAQILMQNITEQDLRIGDHQGWTALHEAVRVGLHEMVRFLAEKMPQNDLKQADKNGQMALHLASMKGCVEIVHILVEKMHPDDLTRGDMFGATPGHWADFSGKEQIVQIFEEKTDQDLRGEDRKNPLIDISNDLGDPYLMLQTM